jgi:hypothetical protein
MLTILFFKFEVVALVRLFFIEKYWNSQNLPVPNKNFF